MELRTIEQVIIIGLKAYNELLGLNLNSRRQKQPTGFCPIANGEKTLKMSFPLITGLGRSQPLKQKPI
jgi:hypothetical protein